METQQWYYAKGSEQRGPVSEQELIGLIESGAVHAADLVWREGMPEWRPARDIAELATAFQKAIPVQEGAVPPPPPLMTAAPGGETNPMAIASLVLGLLSFGCGCFVSIPAIICGHLALSQIKAAPGRYKGRELAIAGLVIGYLTLVISLLFSLVEFYFIFSQGMMPH